MSGQTLRNLLTALVILIVGFAITAMFIKMSNRPERQAPPPTRPTVTAFRVSPEATPVTVRGFGSVKAKRSISVVPQVSGEIVAKADRFEPGSVVTEGDVLLRIDDTDYVLALENARANVAQAEVNLALAEEEAAVAEREWTRLDDGNGEPSALVLREPQLKLAAANVAAARAALDQAQVNLDRCTITAPFDGRVLSADVDAGQYLRAGSAVGMIHATDIAEITVSVPDDDLAWIPVPADGSGDGVPVAVQAEFGGRRHTWEGRAVRLGGAVDPRSRLVPVVVEIADPYRAVGKRPALVEGMFVEVVFTTPPSDGAVVIPREALRPGDVVWVIGTDGALDIRQVEVSRADVAQAVITAGLAAGERICTSNLQYVTSGMVVRVEGDPVPEKADEDAPAKDGDA